MQIWIAMNNKDLPRVMKTKFPTTVMVFGVVSSEDQIISPHIFEVGLKVNIKVYLDVLKSVVIPWCNQVAGGRPWVWQQDSAPAYKVQRDPALASEGVLRLCTLLSLAPLLPRKEPAGLLRLVKNVENITNMSSYNIKASLIAAIRRVFTELPPTLVEKACSQFRIRIEAVIEAEGGYIG